MLLFSRTATNQILLTYLCSRLEWFRFNESAHVMVKKKTLATDLSRRLGLVKNSFRSNPSVFGQIRSNASSFQSNPSSFFSWNCGSNLPPLQLFVLTAPSLGFSSPLERGLGVGHLQQPRSDPGVHRLQRVMLHHVRPDRRHWLRLHIKWMRQHHIARIRKIMEALILFRRLFSVLPGLCPESCYSVF